jgi:hypothetical protein
MDLAGRLSMRQMKEDWEKNDPNAVRRIVDSQGRTHKVMNRECSVCFFMMVYLFVSMLAHLFVCLCLCLSICLFRYVEARIACMQGECSFTVCLPTQAIFLTQGCIPCYPYTTHFAVFS